jgi:hypothetical protein
MHVHNIGSHVHRLVVHRSYSMVSTLLLGRKAIPRLLEKSSSIPGTYFTLKGHISPTETSSTEPEDSIWFRVHR